MARLSLGPRAITKPLILFFGLLLVCLPVFAESNQRAFVLDDFSGGLNLKLSDLALPKKQATVAENVRFDKELKALSKRDQIYSYGSADSSNAITGMHRLYLKDGTKKLLVSHSNEIEVGNDDTGAFTSLITLGSSNRRFQWETWHDLGIGTDGYNQPVKTDGSDLTYLGTCYAEDAGEGAGPNGTYTYKITFYTSSYEVNFNVASNSVTVTDNDIDLSMIPIAPDTFGGEDVVGRKVYRIKNGGSTYYLLSNGTIADNTTTTLTDSDADGEVSATVYPASPDATYTPPKGRLILVHKNRLWIANDPSYPSRIYYSEDGSHDVFVTGNYFDIRPNDGDEITFIKNLLGILTVSKNNTIQKIYTDGDDPDADWIISDPFSFTGNQAIYSAVNSPLGIIYLTYDGIYKFNGQYSTLISDAVTPVINDISESNYDNCWGEFHKNKYYLTYTSEESGESNNNRILVLDILSNAYSIDIFSVNAFCTFNSGTDWDILYSGSSSTGAVYAHSEAVHEILHRKHSDFTGTFDDMRYIPTTYGEGYANSPVLELSWDITIDDASGTIDSHSYGEDAIIDRPDTDGTYISQVLNVNADTFDKVYWNELMPACGGTVYFYLRSGADSATCESASWSSALSDPTGSDASSITANDYVQYKIAMTTNDIEYTPNIYKADGYVVKITYNTEGVTSESSIDLNWESGWLDLDNPGRTKLLRKMIVFHQGTTGTLDITFENYEGDTDTFSINLRDHPSNYEEYFTNGAFRGDLFKVKINESSLNPLKVKKIILFYDLEPNV